MWAEEMNDFLPKMHPGVLKIKYTQGVHEKKQHTYEYFF